MYPVVKNSDSTEDLFICYRFIIDEEQDTEKFRRQGIAQEF